MNGVLVGAGLGFLVAVQVGPMSLLLIRSTLRAGLRTGLAIGAGIAVVDALYAAAGAAGAAPLLAQGPLRLTLGLAGAAVLGWLGLATLRSAVRVRAGFELSGEVARPGRALLTSLGATASNPATIASWAAVFSAASVGTGASPVALVAGVAVGSAGWVTVLACGVAAAGRWVGPRSLAAVDVIAAAGLVGAGAALGIRSVRAT